MLDNVAVLRLDLELARERMYNVFTAYQDGINEMVDESLKKYLTVEYLQDKIDASVRNSIDDEIKNISKDEAVRELVRRIVAGALEKHLDEQIVNSF